MKIPQQSKRCLENREEVEYYFADFVRKGGPPPFKDKIFTKKKLRIYGQNFRRRRSYGFGGYKIRKVVFGVLP